MSRRRRRLLPARTAVLAFALLAVFVAPAAASLRAAADAVACGQVISADTTLTADLTCAGDALVLQGGATLDLGGHAVRGSGSGTGIFVARVGGVDLANTVRNGTVTGFGTGVYVDVALTSIQGLAVSQNAQRGIYVDPLHVTHNVTIAGNTITGNRYGIQFGGGAGYTSQVVDNHVVANTADGILALYGTDNTVFQRNDVSDNGGSGMSISDSFVSIVDNTLDRNHADGLRAENTSLPADVSRWRIGGNSANGNGGHGLNAVTAGLTDLGGNQAARNAVEPQCVNLACKPASTGLVASYSFNAGSGSSVADGTGTGNNGTISGAAWTSAGKYGSALSFDGVNDWVTIPDAASLDLTNGMTLEAWVKPSTVKGMWRTVMFKQRSAGMVYALYAHDGTAPVGQAWIGSERNANGSSALPLNVWTHLATTCDGTTLRLYVNGSLVSSTAVGGSMAATTGVLRIGRNSVWKEFSRARSTRSASTNARFPRVRSRRI
jgi:concanavalin A-like lectin/glucanase superfamily protein/copper-binding protein NosD